MMIHQQYHGIANSITDKPWLVRVHFHKIQVGSSDNLRPYPTTEYPNFDQEQYFKTMCLQKLFDTEMHTFNTCCILSQMAACDYIEDRCSVLDQHS